MWRVHVIVPLWITGCAENCQTLSGGRCWRYRSGAGSTSGISGGQPSRNHQLLSLPKTQWRGGFWWRFLSLITSLKYLNANYEKKKMKGWNPKNFLFFFFKSLLYFTVQYQMEMMRNLRHVNIDHLHVGWYQSTLFGSFISRAFVDSQFNYQHSIEESVVLIYGKTVTFDQFFYLKISIFRPYECMN